MKKKPINTKLHGMIDYAFGFVLVLPWVTDFKTAGEDTLMLGAVGLLVILQSLLTSYEFGLVKIIPMKAHLMLDVLISVFLIASPWIFPVYDFFLYWPLLMGLLGLLVVLLSSTHPYRVSKDDLNITTP